jgi:CRP-like cAMP-binding protein
MPLDASAKASFRETVISQGLRASHLFSDLDSNELRDVANTCTLKMLDKGQYLFREGERAEGFYVMLKGAVNVHRITPDGKEQVICIFRAPDSFAEVTLTTIEVYPANAIALESSQVILVKKKDFSNLIALRPTLSLQMLSSMSFHLKHLINLIEDLKFKHIEARLAHWLTRNCSGDGCSSDPYIVELDMSKRVLASQLGVTAETLSRTLARFRDEGLISVDGRNITVLDCPKLRLYLE